MSLSARLLGDLEFRINEERVALPSGSTLEVLVFLAAQPGAHLWADLEQTWPEVRSLIWPEPFAEFLVQDDQGVRLICSSDLTDYRAAGNDVRQLTGLRGGLMVGFSSDNQAFMAWLAEARFEVERQFLNALLANAAGLAERGRVTEANQNLEYVERERGKLPGVFAARFALDLSRYHWRLNQPAASADILGSALPALELPFLDEARVNLGAALVRLGRPRDAMPVLEAVTAAASLGWALVHLANACRFTDDLEAAVVHAEAAYSAAKLDQDGYLAVAALSIKGEALLARAMIERSDPKDSVIAFGQALGISEVLGEEASAGVLAGLGHAHAVWGNKQKALETAEKAFKRARSAKDGPNATRALLALYATTNIASFARNALSEARACQHQPFEMLALLEVARKDNDAALALEALTMAERIGSALVAARARTLLDSLPA